MRNSQVDKEIEAREKRVAALIATGIDPAHENEIYSLLSKRDIEVRFPSMSAVLHREHLARIDAKIEALRTNPNPAQERRSSVQEDTMANTTKNKDLAAQLRAAQELAVELFNQNQRLQAQAAREPATPGFVRRGQAYASAEDYVARRLGIENDEMEAFGSDEIVGVNADGSFAMKSGRRVRSK